jgi:hypothetical protein
MRSSAARLHYDFAAVEQVPAYIDDTEKTSSAEAEKPQIEHVGHSEQRRIVAKRTMEEEKFEWREVRRGVFDIQTWLTGLAYMCACMSLYSFSLFL